MDIATLRELSGFLFDPKQEVRSLAASHLLGVTGSEEGLALLCSDEKLLADIADNLLRSLSVRTTEFAVVALSTLVNVSHTTVVQERLLKSMGTGTSSESRCPSSF
jgi:hypothetical protein